MNGWSALKNRLDYFYSNIAENLFSHVVTNKSYVKHTFGFICQKSQGNSLFVKEYKEWKRNHKVDFLLKICNIPFSQYMSQKLRDKGYQDLNITMKMALNVKEVKQIIHGCENPVHQEKELEEDVNGVQVLSILAGE